MAGAAARIVAPASIIERIMRIATSFEIGGSSSRATMPRRDVVFGTLLTNIIVVIATLGLCLPGLAMTIRRLHDTNHSGWWVLLAFGTLPGVLLLIFWFCMKGTEGPNRFGPDPMVLS